MANGKKDKSMTPAENTQSGAAAVEFLKPIEITKQVVKQVQKVMNLETGEDDATITVTQTRFIAPSYSEKEFGGNLEAFQNVLFSKACELVQPLEKQIDALLYRATQESYQAGKAEALSTGDFLTQEIRANIVRLMQGNAAYMEVGARECFEKWKVAFIGTDEKKKASAVKLLNKAKELGEEIGI